MNASWLPGYSGSLLRAVSVVFLVSTLGGCSASRMTTSPGHASAIATALSSSSSPSLKQRIDALIPDTLFPPSNLGMKIVSLSRGEVLYELNPDLIFNPASNQKLFTSATALCTLGEQYAFTTTLSADTTGKSALYVRGSGDPVLSTSDLDSMARAAAAALPPGRRWTLTGDVSRFDDEYLGTGWMWDEEPGSYGMFLSPLSLNGNSINVITTPGSRAGDTLRVTTDPVTRYVQIENHGITVVDTVMHPLDVSRRWKERSNVLTVQGEMLGNGHPDTTQLSVWAPERYFLTVLAERLNARGIAVEELAVDTVRPSYPVASYTHTLDSVITYQNKVSDNMSAENVLKTLGAELRGLPGSAEGGLSAVYEWLNGIGVDTTRIVLVDGSGLSRYDLTSANVIVAILKAMHARDEHFPTFLRSLPVAGVDGTLSKRMRGTPAQDNLRAKTGTLGGVTSLSGYVTTADGELLAFSILMQKYPGTARAYRQVQDRIGVLLSTLHRALP